MGSGVVEQLKMVDDVLESVEESLRRQTVAIHMADGWQFNSPGAEAADEASTARLVIVRARLDLDKARVHALRADRFQEAGDD